MARWGYQSRLFVTREPGWIFHGEPPRVRRSIPPPPLYLSFLRAVASILPICATAPLLPPLHPQSASPRTCKPTLKSKQQQQKQPLAFLFSNQTTNQTCVRSSTSREASAVTRSVPSSGRSSPTSTASTPRARTTATPTSSSSASTCTTTRPLVVATSPARSSWTSSREPWTLSALDLSVGFKTTQPRF